MKHGDFAAANVRRATGAVLLALGLSIPMAVKADTVVWTGGASTNWHASGNWTNAGGNAAIPTAGDDVIVNGGPRQPTLSVAAGATNINSLSVGAVNAATLTVANADADARKLIVAGNVTVGPGGVLTHADNSTGEIHRLNLQVGGNLAVSAGGRIDAMGLGYDALKGPGAFTNTAGLRGAAHGGQGRGYNTSPDYPSVPFPCGAAYGNVVAPVRLGSGGGSQAGGGAIILAVAGATTLDGMLTADGFTNGIQSGSGGSVFLTTGTLGGNGTISSKGYCSGSTAGAGGGRIAVVVTNGGSLGSVAVQAFGSVLNPTNLVSGPYPAACGTVFLKTTNDAFGRLLVNNNGNSHPTAGASGTLQAMTWLTSDAGPVTNRFDEIVLTSNAMLVVGTNVTLDLAGSRLACADSSTNAIRSRLVVSATEGSLALPADFVLTNGVISQKGTNQIVWNANVTIGQGGMLTHEEGEGVRTNELNKLNLRIAGNLTVRTNGVIWVLGRGYAFAKGPGFQGMGSGISAGSYGGQASGYSNGIYMASGVPYGSLSRPVQLGSGGGSYGGGGAVVLTVSGTATVDGVVSANAFTNGSRTGSGGSVFIQAGSVEGSGAIEASSFGAIGGGAGGGGRIALVLTNGNSFGSVTLNARGGNVGYFAAGGTLYLKRAQDDYGRLIVDNHTNATPYLTLISPTVTDAEVGDVEIRSSGRLGLAALQNLRVHGSWSNAGAFAASAGSVVTLAGTNTATVWGSTNTIFAGLACTSPAKRVEFAANKAVAVTNSLAFAGAAGPGNLLVLRSTTNGVRWKLTVKAGSAQSVSYADVQDSDADPGVGDPIATSDAVDSGNNTNWNFAVAGPITWTGGSNTLWGEGGNWDLGRPPIPTDTEIVIAPAARQPVLDANRDLANGLTIRSGASLALNGYNLSIGGAVSVTGSLIAAGSEVITFRNQATFASSSSFTAALSTVRFYADGAQTVAPGGASFNRVLVSNRVVSVFAAGFRASEVVFHAASTGATFQGSFTTGLFRCEAPSASLAFTAGGAFAVSNLFVRGTPANPVSLRSTVNDSAWSLVVSGWRFVRYAGVKDSDASGGKAILAPDCVNGGNNPHWDFGAWKTWGGSVSGDFTNGANWAGGTAPDGSSSVLIDGSGSYAPVIAQELTLARLTLGAGQGTVLTVNTNLVVTNDVLIMEYGTLTHAANPIGTNEPYKLSLQVGGDLSILAGGKMDATAKGFPATNGPGATTNAYGGAAYGGQGLGYDQYASEQYPGVGTCYGSFRQPTRLGSGGALRAGGGAIRLEVAGLLDLSGQILAEGDPANNANRTGSGGSIWITTGALAGTGVISVASYAQAAGGGAGGGGRMAVEVTNAVGFGGVVFLANGGNDGYFGAAGSIYLKHAGDPVGRVVIDNRTVVRRSAVTQIPAPLLAVADELRAIPLVVTNTSWVRLTADCRAGDLLVYTNSLLSMSNHVLRVQASEHHLTNSLTPGAGGTNQVDFYDQILWKQAVGTVIMLK